MPGLLFWVQRNIEMAAPRPRRIRFFNDTYVDGSQRSNRRVPSEMLGGLDGDQPAKEAISEQDREIAEKSGKPPLEIASVERVGAKKK